MKVAAVQTDIVWESPEENFERVRPLVQAAADAGSELIVLPEMFACGFSMNVGVVAEPPDGASATFLQDQARATGAWVCGSIPERRPGEAKPFNSFVLASPDGVMERYHKIHPFSPAKEHEHYGSGDAFVTVTIRGLRLTLFVCYDLRFADEFWQTAGGTDAYVVVANWPEPRRSHWRTLLRARAIENQAYVIGVNRVGSDGAGLVYVGDSAIIDPSGAVIAEAGSEPETLHAEIDAARVAKVREEFPFLRDRR